MNTHKNMKHDFFDITTIPGCQNYDKILPINGYSAETKYYIRTTSGEEMFLFIGKPNGFNTIEEIANNISLFAKNNIPTYRLLDYGELNLDHRGYVLLSWINGTSVKSIIEKSTDNDINYLAELSAETLHRIHTLAEAKVQYLQITFCDIIQQTIDEFANDNELIAKFPYAETFLDFLSKNKNNAEIIEQQCILHGDYHCDNLIFDGHSVYAIDWIYGKTGCYIEDFVRNVISAETSPLFASSLIKHYFCGNIPDLFWELLAIYTAIHELKITKLTFPVLLEGEPLVEHQHKLVINQYKNMLNMIPAYFIK